MITMRGDGEILLFFVGEKGDRLTDVCFHRMTEAKDFQGPGGPEDKMKIVEERRPGDDGVPVQRTNF